MRKLIKGNVLVHYANISPAMPVGKWNDHYFRLGVEYYISGRQAVILQHMVAGNLLHHALEMFLKAAFREAMVPNELKVKYGHRLKKLWSDFKQLADEARLDAYDPLVAELDHWEDIRYPDFNAGERQSRVQTVDLIRSDVRNEPMKETRYFNLNLEEFDELFETLVEVMHVGKRYLWMAVIRGRAAGAYTEENRHIIAKVDS